MEIPFKAYASPNTLAHGDMVALYAGNGTPSHATTFLRLIDTGKSFVTMVTADGRYDVPRDARIWVADWAPVATFIPETRRKPACTRAQRHAARFAPMGVR